MLRIILTAFLVTAASALSVRAQWERLPLFPSAPKATIGQYIFTSDASGLFVSKDSGATWTQVDSGLGSSPSIIQMAAIGTNLFALNASSGIFRSSDSGISWVAANSGLLNQYEGYSAVAVKGQTLFVSTNRGVFSSTNNGDSWVSTSEVPPDNDVTCLAANNSDLFAVIQGVYISSDDGKNWESINNGLGGGITNLTVIGNFLFAGSYGGGVYRSTNSGLSWENLNNGLTNLRVNVIKGFGSNIFAGTDGSGVFLSTNDGLTWQSANSGIRDSLSLLVFNFNISGKYLFVEEANGVWRRPLSDFNTDAVSSPVFANNSLSNYPNPFSQSTTINFSSPESGVAEVTIVNLLGSEVARIFSGELSAGEHSFKWSKPPSLPEGMYECIVRMNGRVEQMPMMLLP